MIAPSQSTLPTRSHDDDFAASVCDLLRLYARHRRSDSDVLQALEESGEDPAALLAEGLLTRCPPDDPQGYRSLVRAGPELWWLDLELAVNASAHLETALDTNLVERLRADSLSLIRTLDKGERSPAHDGPRRLFSSLVAAVAPSDRARVLSRGVARAAQLLPDWLAPIFELLSGGASLDLLRALARDEVLTSDARWIAALLLRGGPRDLSLCAATLLFADDDTRVGVRDLLSLSPKRALLRVAEVHGLLTLAGDAGLEAAEILRTALLTQVWQGADLTEVPFWEAWRGELIITRSLLELGASAAPLSRALAAGLPELLSAERPLSDPARRDAMTVCLTWLITRDRDYCAAMRLSEARLRDIARTRGEAALGPPLRAYAHLLVAVAGALTELGRAADGRTLYGRVLRLRAAHAGVLPRAAFPDSLTGAVRVAARAPEPGIPPVTTSRRADDPLPSAQEIVASADAAGTLPSATAQWVGASAFDPADFLGWLVPLPLRFLGRRLLDVLGSTPRAKILLSDDGRGAMIVRHRIMGVTVHTARRAIPGGRLFPFPVGNLRADRLLGRWAAILITLGTIGPWLALRANTAEGALAGAGLAVFGLLGYLGALGIRRSVMTGGAVAVRDQRGRVSVWKVDDANRFVLDRRVERTQIPGKAAVTPYDPDAPAPPARHPELLPG